MPEGTTLSVAGRAAGAAGAGPTLTIAAQLPAFELAAAQAASATLQQQYESAAAQAAERRRAKMHQEAVELAEATNSTVFSAASDCGWPAVVFTLKLPTVAPESLPQHELLDSVQAAMPMGAFVKISHVASAPGGGTSVTLGARLPATAAAAMQAEELLRTLQTVPVSIVPSALGTPSVLAVQSCVAELLPLSFQLPLADYKDGPEFKALLEADIRKQLAAPLPGACLGRLRREACASVPIFHLKHALPCLQTIQS